MELLEGGDLGDLISKSRHLSDADLFRYIDQFTAAVANMHKVGVLHRDLKPENLILTKDLKEVKIIDFGIATILTNAKLQDTSDSEDECDFKKNTTQVGTPMWQPPELLEKSAGYTRKSDIYACGMLMQFAVTGEEPHERISDWAKWAIPKQTGNPKSFTYLIHSIMAKCLQANIEDRPDSMREIRRVVHANLLFAAYTSNNPQAAIDCVKWNEDFDVCFVHSDLDNVSSLHVAAWCESLEMTEALLKKKPTPAIIDHKDNSGCTPIWFACSHGCLDVAKALEKAGADLRIAEKCKMSCLMRAS